MNLKRLIVLLFLLTLATTGSVNAQSMLSFSKPIVDSPPRYKTKIPKSEMKRVLSDMRESLKADQPGEPVASDLEVQVEEMPGKPVKEDDGAAVQLTANAGESGKAEVEPRITYSLNDDLQWSKAELFGAYNAPLNPQTVTDSTTDASSEADKADFNSVRRSLLLGEKTPNSFIGTIKLTAGKDDNPFKWVHPVLSFNLAPYQKVDYNEQAYKFSTSMVELGVVLSGFDGKALLGIYGTRFEVTDGLESYRELFSKASDVSDASEIKAVQFGRGFDIAIDTSKGLISFQGRQMEGVEFESAVVNLSFTAPIDI